MTNKFPAVIILGFLLWGGEAGLCQQGLTKPVITAAPVVNPAQSMPLPPPAFTGPVAISPSYVIGPEDAITVTVWKEPTLTGSLLVRPDGKISMPLIGDLPAAGLTPVSLGADITERLKKFITDPTVTVNVTAPNSQRIYFVGEISRPGPVLLTPDMTMLQAVSSAGGLTPFANAKHIYILRGDKAHQQKILFDYKKAVKQGNQQGLNLLAGDTIVVP